MCQQVCWVWVCTYDVDDWTLPKDHTGALGKLYVSILAAVACATGKCIVILMIEFRGAQCETQGASPREEARQ